MMSKSIDVIAFVYSFNVLLHRFIEHRRQIDPGNISQSKEDWWDDFVDFVESVETT